MRLIGIGILILMLSPIGYTGQPVFGLSVITKAPYNVAHNASASAVYSVTNNSTHTHTLAMLPLAGITQITTTTGACPASATLTSGQSCLLNLRINGFNLPLKTLSGPVVCQVEGSCQQPSPFLCSQPSSEDSLNITRTNDELIDKNAWISVLIAQDAPPLDTPADMATYVKQVHALAPAAEQVHLRVVPIENPTVGPASTPAYLPIYQAYADLIALLQTAYAVQPSFQIGFHPDNSNGSQSYWGCSSADWQCVLNNSIIVMNNINELADPQKKGEGFTIFSIEQSYVEPVDDCSLQMVKGCLNSHYNTTPGCLCPIATFASPVVKYGDVLPSYGGSDIYGPNELDYGYPQYYNLVGSLNQTDANILMTSNVDSYLPANSAANCISQQATYPFNVIDANLSGRPIRPTATQLIPCFTPNVDPTIPYPNPTNDVYAYQNQANPSLTAAYVAYLMTQLPPIRQQVDTNGSTVYITFSGEPEFLGSTGWTLDKINAFHQQLNTNFSTLNTLIPGIIPPAANTNAIKYAIWNFTSILENNP